MINQLRTLLLNDVPQQTSQYEEYIEPWYVPLGMDAPCSRFRQLLFKPNWPRYYRNFLATQLYLLASTSSYAGLLALLDPRTVLSGTEFSVEAATVIQRTSGDQTLQAYGSFVPLASAGIFQGSWQVSYASGNSVEVLDLLTGVSRVAELFFHGDVSSPVQPDGRSPFWFNFVGATAVPNNLLSTITTSVPMGFDVMGMISHLNSDNVALSIFDLPTYAPYLNSLRDRFINSSRPDRKLAAAVIAYGIRASTFLP